MDWLSRIGPHGHFVSFNAGLMPLVGGKYQEKKPAIADFSCARIPPPGNSFGCNDAFGTLPI
jgi:hypothetical protein